MEETIRLSEKVNKWLTQTDVLLADDKEVANKICGK